MRIRRGGLALALSVTLAGCAGTTYVPVEERADEPVIAPAPGEPATDTYPPMLPPPQPDTAPPPAPPRPAAPTAPSPALLALLDQAETQERQGQMQRALSYLERAQRISPREPRVYLQLARVRLAMNDTRRAAQLVERGLALSTGDPATRRALQQLQRQIEQRR